MPILWPKKEIPNTEDCELCWGDGQVDKDLWGPSALSGADEGTVYKKCCDCGGGGRVEWFPLRRKDLGIKHDALFSPYMPSYRYLVYFHQGIGHQSSETFRTKTDAESWIRENRK